MRAGPSVPYGLVPYVRELGPSIRGSPVKALPETVELRSNFAVDKRDRVHSKYSEEHRPSLQI